MNLEESVKGPFNKESLVLRIEIEGIYSNVITSLESVYLIKYDYIITFAMRRKEVF